MNIYFRKCNVFVEKSMFGVHFFLNCVMQNMTAEHFAVQCCCEFVFLTNATHISSSLVAELYKNRWQIELFFKWLKQHLKIKKFWGATENAVIIQLYVAICTYLLVTIVKNNMKLERSTYKVLQILSISLTDKTHLKDLFDKTKFQYDKDRFGFNGPNLFNV